ncbi:hypothetical protein M422DRAFT_274508 [Sphaerobolus stellatus SS14]|uniref:Uncharacterized protein n=1 Tax=Sphaerobolus stellatus (strain SS14) TaxID=990650 RepID=A0A0C9U698_SPHS4|nr:hypothetical protein M422DRAFT_274508 [Sphaerobolus stellatus SS14]
MATKVRLNNSMAKLSEYSESESVGKIHIVLQILEKVQPLTAPKEPLIQLWESLWGVKREIIFSSEGDVDYIPSDVLEAAHVRNLLLFPEDVLIIPQGFGRLSEEVEESLKKFRRVDVTGQSRIGKSAFALYLLVERLIQEKPTVFQFSTEFFLHFDSHGTKHIAASVEARDIDVEGTDLIIVDTNQAPSPLLNSFLKKNAEAKILILLDPAKTQDLPAPWPKEKLVWDPPSTEIDIKAAEKILSMSLIKDFKDWMPSLVICFQFCQTPGNREVHEAEEKH